MLNLHSVAVCLLASRANQTCRMCRMCGTFRRAGLPLACGAVDGTAFDHVLLDLWSIPREQHSMDRRHASLADFHGSTTIAVNAYLSCMSQGAHRSARQTTADEWSMTSGDSSTTSSNHEAGTPLYAQQMKSNKTALKMSPEITKCQLVCGILIDFLMTPGPGHTCPGRHQQPGAEELS